MSDFNFADLAVADEASDAPLRPSKAPRVLDTPFVGWVRDSIETGATKVIIVPTEELADQARALARQAASYLDSGIRSGVTPVKNGFKVSFRAANKRRAKEAE